MSHNFPLRCSSNLAKLVLVQTLFIVAQEASGQASRSLACVEGTEDAKWWCSDAKCQELYGAEKGTFNKESLFCESGEPAPVITVEDTLAETTADNSEKTLCEGGETWSEEYAKCICSSSQENECGDDGAGSYAEPVTYVGTSPPLRSFIEARNTQVQIAYLLLVVLFLANTCLCCLSCSLKKHQTKESREQLAQSGKLPH